MIDTIRIKMEMDYCPDVYETFSHERQRNSEFPDWRFSEPDGRVEGYKGRLWRAFHEPTGLSVERPKPRKRFEGKTVLNAGGPEFDGVIIQCSLPRVIDGSKNNTRHLQNQSEINLAIQQLRTIVGEILDRGRLTFEFKRIDLVWNLPITPARLINLLRHARHPNIRKGATVVEGESVYFNGTYLRISAYDKNKQMKEVEPATSTRVEVQLKSKKLYELFGRQPICDFTFDECYQIYRKVLCVFDTASYTCLADIAYSEAALMALAMHNGVTSSPGGSSLVEWKCRGSKVGTKKKFDRQVRKAHTCLWPEEFRFTNLLPENRPPPLSPPAVPLDFLLSQAQRSM